MHANERLSKLRELLRRFARLLLQQGGHGRLLRLFLLCCEGGRLALLALLLRLRCHRLGLFPQARLLGGRFVLNLLRRCACLARRYRSARRALPARMAFCTESHTVRRRLGWIGGDGSISPRNSTWLSSCFPA